MRASRFGSEVKSNCPDLRLARRILTVRTISGALAILELPYSAEMPLQDCANAIFVVYAKLRQTVSKRPSHFHDKAPETPARILRKPSRRLTYLDRSQLFPSSVKSHPFILRPTHPLCQRKRQPTHERTSAQRAHADTTPPRPRRGK
jgi:hypothetical protein